MALRPDGKLAVSDTLSNAIYLVSTNNNSTPVLLAGGNGPGWQDGIPQYAKFDQPHGIAVSGDGRMVVCDTMNNRVRIIDTQTNTTTLYGTASNVWTATLLRRHPGALRGMGGRPGRNHEHQRLGALAGQRHHFGDGRLVRDGTIL